MKLSLSPFLKAEDVKTGDLIKILDEGEQVESTFKDENETPKMNYNFRVSLEDGTEKIISINKTSLKLLAEKYTLETKTWVNKLAKINVAI